MKIPGVERRGVESLGREDVSQPAKDAQRGNNLFNSSVNTFNRVYQETAVSESSKAATDMQTRMQDVVLDYANNPGPDENEWKEKIDAIANDTDNTGLLPRSQTMLAEQIYGIAENAKSKLKVTAAKHNETLLNMKMAEAFVNNGMSAKAKSLLQDIKNYGIHSNKAGKEFSTKGQLDEFWAEGKKYIDDNNLSGKEELAFQKLLIETASNLSEDMSTAIIDREATQTSLGSRIQLTAAVTPLLAEIDRDSYALLHKEGKLNNQKAIMESQQQKLNLVAGVMTAFHASKAGMPLDQIQAGDFAQLIPDLAGLHGKFENVMPEHMETWAMDTIKKILDDDADKRDAAATNARKVAQAEGMKNLATEISLGNTAAAWEIFGPLKGLLTPTQIVQHEHDIKMSEVNSSLSDSLTMWRQNKDKGARLPDRFRDMLFDINYSDYASENGTGENEVWTRDEWEAKAKEARDIKNNRDINLYDAKDQKAINKMLVSRWLKPGGEPISWEEIRAKISNGTVLASRPYTTGAEKMKIAVAQKSLALFAETRVLPFREQGIEVKKQIDVMKEQLYNYDEDGNKVSKSPAEVAIWTEQIEAVEEQTNAQLKKHEEFCTTETQECIARMKGTFGEASILRTFFAPAVGEDPEAGSPVGRTIVERVASTEAFNAQMGLGDGNVLNLFYPEELDTFSNEWNGATAAEKINLIDSVFKSLPNDPGLITSLFNHADIPPKYKALGYIMSQVTYGGSQENKNRIASLKNAVQKGIVAQEETGKKSAEIVGTSKTKSVGDTTGEEVPIRDILQNAMFDALGGISMGPMLAAQLDLMETVHAGLNRDSQSLSPETRHKYKITHVDETLRLVIGPTAPVTDMNAILDEIHVNTGVTIPVTKPDETYQGLVDKVMKMDPNFFAHSPGGGKSWSMHDTPLQEDARMVSKEPGTRQYQEKLDQGKPPKYLMHPEGHSRQHTWGTAALLTPGLNIYAAMTGYNVSSDIQHKVNKGKLMIVYTGGWNDKGQKLYMLQTPITYDSLVSRETIMNPNDSNQVLRFPLSDDALASALGSRPSMRESQGAGRGALRTAAGLMSDSLQPQAKSGFWSKDSDKPFEYDPKDAIEGFDDTLAQPSSGEMREITDESGNKYWGRQ